MELYFQINEKIIEQYDSSKIYFESIKNIEKITFEFDDIESKLKKYENNIKK